MTNYFFLNKGQQSTAEELAVFIRIVLLQHSCMHLFTCYQWQLLPYNSGAQTERVRLQAYIRYYLVSEETVCLMMTVSSTYHEYVLIQRNFKNKEKVYLTLAVNTYELRFSAEW